MAVQSHTVQLDTMVLLVAVVLVVVEQLCLLDGLGLCLLFVHI